MLAEDDAPEEEEEEADGMASRVRWAETLRSRLCAAAAEERVVGMVEKRQAGGSSGLLLTKPCVAGSVLAWTGGVRALLRGEERAMWEVRGWPTGRALWLASEAMRV